MKKNNMGRKLHGKVITWERYNIGDRTTWGGTKWRHYIRRELEKI